MGACRESLIGAEAVLHSIGPLKNYGVELYDTWCDMMVDGRCSPDDEIGNCDYEQFNVNSPMRSVDLFQNQASHPEEGMFMPDGSKISCASNDAVYLPAEVECPPGFTTYDGDETSDLCVLPCLSFLFDEDQIDAQFSVYIGVGLFGMLTNLILVGSYAMSGKKKRKSGAALPVFVVQAAVFGLLFTLFDTLPTALLKFDLSCSDGCVDEFCHGDSTPCKLGQPAEYLLLAVLCILLNTLLQLYCKTIRMSTPATVRKVSKYFTAFSTTLVLLCVVLCLLADSDLLESGSAEYRQLIVARDSFNCGPRFSTGVQEFAFLTLPFALVCMTLVCVTGALQPCPLPK
jgi:hypothetical protein